MNKKNNKSQPNKNKRYEIKPRQNSKSTVHGNVLYKPLHKHNRINASIESEGTTPIDISLMTGNGQTKEGE